MSRVLDAEREAEALVSALPPMVPVRRAAQFLGVSVRSLQRWASSGRIRLIRTSKARNAKAFVSRVELARFLVSLMATPRV